jgi:hypothetical protein
VQEAEARNDGSLFMATYEKFQELAQEIGALLPDRAGRGSNRWRQSSPIPDHLMKDLQDSVDRALAVESGDSFASRLEYQCHTPESARFILPQLMVAMGLYLHLKRLHVAITYLPERFGRGPKQLPPAVVFQNMIDKVGEMKDALLKARSSFEAFTDSKVAQSGLAGTPEAIMVIAEVTRHYFGDQYAVHHQDYKKTNPKGSSYLGKAFPGGPDKVDTGIAQLSQIARNLSQDLALINGGKWPQHLFDLKFEDDPGS